MVLVGGGAVFVYKYLKSSKNIIKNTVAMCGDMFYDVCRQLLPVNLLIAGFIRKEGEPIEMGIDYKALGKRVREYRKIKGLTQEQLCEEIGIVSQHHISMIETGTRAPSLEILVRIANALGITVDDLLQEELIFYHNPSWRSQAESVFNDCTVREIQALIECLSELKRIIRELK